MYIFTTAVVILRGILCGIQLVDVEKNLDILYGTTLLLNAFDLEVGQLEAPVV